MNRYFRLFLFAVCAVQLFFAVGFLLRLPAVLRLWPLAYTNRMAFTFIASIFAAAAASTFWCIAARESRGLAGIALDYMTILIPLSIFAFQLAVSSQSSALTLFGIGCVLEAI